MPSSPVFPVSFVGAGPGDPDLITVRGLARIREADLVLYAGSLVPRELMEQARPGAAVRDSSPMTLEQTHAAIRDAVREGARVARVHTGDPSLYGAVQEQARLLEADGIDYEIVPGVSAAFAAAAEARVSFTVPDGTQSLILTRMAGRTPVPETENISRLAATGASMAVYLSAADADALAQALAEGGLAPQTPVVVGHRVGWPGGETFATTLGDMAGQTASRGISRQAVFLILPERNDTARSKLYDPGFRHGFRP